VTLIQGDEWPLTDIIIIVHDSTEHKNHFTNCIIILLTPLISNIHEYLSEHIVDKDTEAVGTTYDTIKWNISREELLALKREIIRNYTERGVGHHEIDLDPLMRPAVTNNEMDNQLLQSH